jgi:hypothetical protein
MNRLTRSLCLVALAVAAAGAQAQPGHPPLPPGEVLALAPGLDAAAAKEIRRIESERRDAHDQLAIRQRGEHARIDDDAEQQLRKRLGDEGYRNYIAWKASVPRPPRPTRAWDGGGHTPRADAPAPGDEALPKP